MTVTQCRGGAATDLGALRRVHFLQVPFHFQPGLFLSPESPKPHEQECQNTSGDDNRGDWESAGDQHHQIRPHGIKGPGGRTFRL